MVGQRVLEKLQLLLHEKSVQLKALFDAIVDNQRLDFTTITYIQESIHWLILISAFFLADGGEGEQPLVPDALMQLSISQVFNNVVNVVTVVNVINVINVTIFFFLGKSWEKP